MHPEKGLLAPGPRNDIVLVHMVPPTHTKKKINEIVRFILFHSISLEAKTKKSLQYLSFHDSKIKDYLWDTLGVLNYEIWQALADC